MSGFEKLQIQVQKDISQQRATTSSSAFSGARFMPSNFKNRLIYKLDSSAIPDEYKVE
jgi:hypothetical protein